ncbi:hypothetical protein SAMN03159332_2559 [Paenibacillus sp. 276b]|nr:hypothetical protein SAMN03159332_2559 [Paenibacillus sp. 276b]
MANKHLKDIIRETTEVLKEESHQHGALHEIHPNDVERVLRRGLDTILENLVQGNRIYLINSFNLEPKDYDAKYVKNLRPESRWSLNHIEQSLSNRLSLPKNDSRSARKSIR